MLSGVVVGAFVVPGEGVLVGPEGVVVVVVLDAEILKRGALES